VTDPFPFGASSGEYGSPQAEFDIPYGNLAQNCGYAHPLDNGHGSRAPRTADEPVAGEIKGKGIHAGAEHLHSPQLATAGQYVRQAENAFHHRSQYDVSTAISAIALIELDDLDPGHALHQHLLDPEGVEVECKLHY
jgi:hypothetical protein